MGSIHIVTVRSFTNFGVRLESKYKYKYKSKSKFKSELELELKFKSELEELEYLLYNDEISWIKKINNSINIYKKGDLVKLIVLGLDLITRKINFGSKQLIKNFWYENIIGSIHTGKIIKSFYKGAIIKFKKKNIKIFAPILKHGVKLKNPKFKIIYFNFKIKTFYVYHIL
ncbi:hypothetical protein [Candidatus Karelsulcia muelleri]|nr:hypothetical protein [Candidatus Karelsulcia muelleri]